MKIIIEIYGQDEEETRNAINLYNDYHKNGEFVIQINKYSIMDNKDIKLLNEYGFIEFKNHHTKMIEYRKVK